MGRWVIPISIYGPSRSFPFPFLNWSFIPTPIRFLRDSYGIPMGIGDPIPVVSNCDTQLNVPSLSEIPDSPSVVEVVSGHCGQAAGGI